MNSHVFKVEGKTGLSVVKISKQAYAGEAAAKMDKEIEVAKALNNSPYFIGLKNHFKKNNLLYSVWDFAEFGSLREFMEKGNTLGRVECCKLMQYVAKGLDQLHTGSFQGIPSIVCRWRVVALPST